MPRLHPVLRSVVLLSSLVTFAPAASAAIDAPRAPAVERSGEPDVGSATTGIWAPGTDWRSLIDAAWGPAPWTVGQMLEQFDAFWAKVDSSYACFQGINVDWLALRNKYRPEIEAGGISRGRFVAILNHLDLALRDPRTRIFDFTVDRYDSLGLRPNLPLFAFTPRGDVNRFGAALTPLPDSSLLVYSAIPDHPLGLVPGDIVLGYDGVPWQRLYPELLAAELPICGGQWGANPASYTHSLLISAGVNWHLFSTIDVVKYATGQTVHLPVAPLANATQTIGVYEQLPVPGVRFPDGAIGGHTPDPVSWGIVENTQVGYIYVRAWLADAGVKFANAIDSLANVHHVDGIIIDFRTNFGGIMSLSYAGIQKLFATNLYTVGFDVRCTGGGHLTMCPSPGQGPDMYMIHGTAAKTYNRPIALLVGPGAIGSGEQIANLVRYHPRTRVFGKSTAGAFNYTSPVTLPLPGWAADVATENTYRTSNRYDYLTHDEFPVEQSVWLTPETVARGEDNVVTAALQWIADETTATLMASFDAAPVERGVELRWSFGEPERVTRVEIERAGAVAGPWAATDVTVGSDGGMTTALDATAAAGATYYYRLLVTLTDGSHVTFGPISSTASPSTAENRLELSPNPASAASRVDFAISRAGPVRIEVLDIAGRVVSRLLDAAKPAGRYSLAWDRCGGSGDRAPAGIYFVRMHSGGREVRRRLVLLD